MSDQQSKAECDNSFMERDAWTIVDAYFQKHSISSQQIHSYNDFIDNVIPKILDDVPEIIIEEAGRKKHHYFKITSEAHELKQPNFIEPDTEESKIYPNTARLRNIAYSGDLMIRVKYMTKIEGKLRREVGGSKNNKLYKIGRIPIMVMSNHCRLTSLDPSLFQALRECPMDPGGYFIIDGKEKVVMTQERAANNTAFVFRKYTNTKSILECEIRSCKEDSTASAKAFWVKLLHQRIKMDPRMGIWKKNNELTSKELIIKVMFPGLTGPVPLHVIYQAIGFDSPKFVFESIVEVCARHSPDTEQEALNFIVPLLVPSLHAWKKMTPDEAKDEIGSLYIRPNNDFDKSLDEESFEEQTQLERERFVSNLLTHSFLPHIGTEAEDSCFQKKGLYLSYMVWKLLMVYSGQIPHDDRDHLQNKRYQCSGPLIAQIFQQAVVCLRQEMEKQLRMQIRKGETPDIGRAMSPTFVTNYLKHCLASGTWGNLREMRSKNSRIYSNVTQELNRYTRNSHLSSLRRLNSPEDKLSLMTKPRQLHSTYFGVICPFETPEGTSIGLVKNMALLAQITVSVPIQKVIDFVIQKGVVELEYAVEQKLYKKKCMTKVFVDGRWIGFVDSPNEFLQKFRAGRQSGEISHYVSICWEHLNKSIEIRADAGRLCRPLLVVKNNRALLKRKYIKRLKENKLAWDDLLKLGFVEIMDVRESESALIAMDLNSLRDKDPNVKDYTHLEIHPALMMGICASTVPFANHTQSPRIVYQAGIAKQAMGVYGTNLFHRMDTTSHFLHYGQKPIVQGKAMKYFNFDESPAGSVCTVAIAAYSGYNMEDSIILNRSAVERGLFRATMFQTYQEKAEKFRYSLEEEGEYIFAYPSHVVTKRIRIVAKGQSDEAKMKLYKNIGNDGLPTPGERVGYEDLTNVKSRSIPSYSRDYDPMEQQAIIGRVRTLSKKEIAEDSARLSGRDAQKLNIVNSPFLYQDASKFERKPMFSYVDSALLTTNNAGERIAKVRIRKHLKPQVGDKFASLHGQKGVIGLDFHEVDLPFTKQGIIPDLIMNPHGLPSRMTIGQLYESLYGKAACLAGKILDGTTFHTRKREEVEDILKAHGFYEDGTEVMYDGRTGRRIMSRIFIGPTYYQRLKHLVDDKIHSRARGTVEVLTQQPVQGFSREGGLRLGEMERDCLIANGSFLFLMERLMDVSDGRKFQICSECGLLASKTSMWVTSPKGTPAIERYDTCLRCAKENDGRIHVPQIYTIRIPYAAKLFFQELMCMNIIPRIVPSDTKMDPSRNQALYIAETLPTTQDLIEQGTVLPAATLEEELVQIKKKSKGFHGNLKLISKPSRIEDITSYDPQLYGSKEQ